MSLPPPLADDAFPFEFSFAVEPGEAPVTVRVSGEPVTLEFGLKPSADADR